MKDYFYKVTSTRYLLNVLPFATGFFVLCLKHDHIHLLAYLTLGTALVDALYMIYDKSKQDN